MSKANDFSDDLADVKHKVSSDVDAILKLVRQTEGRDSIQPSPQPENSDPTPLAAAKSPPSKPAKPRTARTPLTPGPTLTEQVVLENVTTRLRRETNELLTEAALRQKLKKETPSTRQDIIDTALQDWFLRNGYASSKA
jgi:hypothetical protein